MVHETPTSTLPPQKLLQDNQCAPCFHQDQVWCVNKSSVLCKPEPDGWLVWLRRVDGSVLFNRTWDEYAAGFGDPDGNYWLGLEYLHAITGTGRPCKLRVEVESWSGKTDWAEYSRFSVGNYLTNYTLDVGGHSGPLSDSLTWGNLPIPFSTLERRNNFIYGPFNCATKYGGGGGWWYEHCSPSKPTSVYKEEQMYNATGRYMYWGNVFGQRLKSLVMKVQLHSIVQ